MGACNPDASERERKFEEELENLTNHISEDSSERYSYVTEDLEEAKEAAREAVAIYKKYGFEHMTDCISITKQSECPKCGHLGRFRDVYCPRCGTKLTPAEEMDLE